MINPREIERLVELLERPRSNEFIAALVNFFRAHHAELAQAQKDAERYRYLVEANPDEGPAVMVHRQDDWGNWRHDVITGVVLDAAIDAKLREGPPTPEDGK